MREYLSEEIRNVAVIGHGGSGKTSLVDALVFAAGLSKRHGAVADGTALTDFSAEEAERGYSIALGCAFAEWMDSKINLIDTPGYADFIGDALAGLSAADGALLVVGATAGVEVGHERMFREAVERRDPVLIAVTMMDREQARFDEVYAQITRQLTTAAVPVEIPLGEGPDFRGVINLFTRKGYAYRDGARAGEYDVVDIPESEQARVARYREQLIEAISATDDRMLERYLNDAEIGRDEAIAGMKEAMKRQELYPVFCVSAESMVGVRALLTELVQLMPSAREMEELHGLTGAEGERTVEIRAEDDAPFAAHVFKTISEPHVGEVSYFRIYAGSVRNGDEVYNATRDHAEKLSHLSVAEGRDRTEVPLLHAGDIGCVAKLRNTHTNDTLSTREHPVRLPRISFPEPLVSYAVHPSVRGEEDKVQQGLHRLHDEDPTLGLHYVADTHESVVTGMGERHLEVALARLERRQGVRAELTRPRVAYRETLTREAKGQGRHKKQSGGRGQFGDCWVTLRPLPPGSGYRFHDRIVGGAIPSKYVPAVDRGIQEAAARGVLGGFPMVDFECELCDGSYHSVDSNEMAFRMAAILAFRSVAPQCGAVLLEPIDAVDVTTPDDYVGDVLGDLSSRRGQIQGTERSSDGRGTVIHAFVPQAELHLYTTTLHSLTHGRGTVSRRAGGYEPVPADAARRVLADSPRVAESATA